MNKFLREFEDAATLKDNWFAHGNRPLVIVVDEANALKQMANQAVSSLLIVGH